MHPAVRNPTGSCIEEDNCNWEMATLCAFNNTNTAGSVAFLACMDDSAANDALDAAKACASAGSIDMSAIAACYSGSQGKALLATASAYYNKQFSAATYVPHVFVDKNEFFGDNGPTYAKIKTALCAAGSTASVCKQTADPVQGSCLI